MLSLSGASSVTLGANGQTAGIQTVVGGNDSSILDASAYTTLAVKLDNSASTVTSSLFGGAQADTLIGGLVSDTLQAWSGVKSNNSSDTLTGGEGADLFILGNSTDNAYGYGARASITDFVAGEDGDQIQLHNFGSTNSDYSTSFNDRSSVLNIFYDGDAVAAITISSGGFFDWTKNVQWAT